MKQADSWEQLSLWAVRFLFAGIIMEICPSVRKPFSKLSTD
jgi:hypothetical protein